jgi:hypothetical protein
VIDLIAIVDIAITRCVPIAYLGLAWGMTFAFAKSLCSCYYLIGAVARIITISRADFNIKYCLDNSKCFEVDFFACFMHRVTQIVAACHEFAVIASQNGVFRRNSKKRSLVNSKKEGIH